MALSAVVSLSFPPSSSPPPSTVPPQIPPTCPDSITEALFSPEFGQNLGQLSLISPISQYQHKSVDLNINPRSQNTPNIFFAYRSEFRSVFSLKSGLYCCSGKLCLRLYKL
ncbi:hypothetical protein FOMPIDRAFT_1019704 [Fomitopsis schrenkii]|uniref:Uncharacterized protein n=1 Tax=Fomitopsis schrenkii TaxID=2126942 RepID=S8DNS5_FOMSC|nr:hypothetical protein FOMPIDRAFT_1019704 [Fomitopsis schrenkii]